MNYREMTDFEINCAVTKALGMSHAFFFSKSEEDFYEEIGPEERGPIWQSGKYEVNGYRVSNGNCFNPCNSWADAGPIIQEYGIGLMPFKNSDAAAWDTSCGLLSAEKVNHENPLRAAMIAFLIMQEGV